jgi:hypothetical protein
MLFGKLLQEGVTILQVVYLPKSVAHHFCLEVDPSIIFQGWGFGVEKDAWHRERVNFTAGSVLKSGAGGCTRIKSLVCLMSN